MKDQSSVLMQFPITCKSGQPSILSQVKGYFPNGSIKVKNLSGNSRNRKYSVPVQALIREKADKGFPFARHEVSDQFD